jgi:hypothetical protein
MPLPLPLPLTLPPPLPLLMLHSLPPLPLLLLHLLQFFEFPRRLYGRGTHQLLRDRSPDEDGGYR